MIQLPDRMRFFHKHIINPLMLRLGSGTLLDHPTGRLTWACEKRGKLESMKNSLTQEGNLARPYICLLMSLTFVPILPPLHC